MDAMVDATMSFLTAFDYLYKVTSKIKTFYCDENFVVHYAILLTSCYE